MRCQGNEQQIHRMASSRTLEHFYCGLILTFLADDVTRYENIT